jgi:hypothetical protein
MAKLVLDSENEGISPNGNFGAESRPTAFRLTERVAAKPSVSRGVYAPFTRSPHISRRDSTGIGVLLAGPKHEADVPMFPDLLLGGVAAAAAFAFLIAVLWRPELF